MVCVSTKILEAVLIYSDTDWDLCWSRLESEICSQ